MTTDTENPDQPVESVNTLVEKLQKGQEWLNNQHEYYLEEYTVAVDDATFYEQLSAWEEHEKTLRQSGYKGCIWQPLSRCPIRTVVRCNGCIPEQPSLW